MNIRQKTLRLWHWLLKSGRVSAYLSQELVRTNYSFLRGELSRSRIARKLARRPLSPLADIPIIAERDEREREEIRRRFGPAESDHPSNITISVVTPVYNVDTKWLLELCRSLIDQSHQNWELVLVDDASPLPTVREALEAVALADSRIRPIFRETNGGIAAATNDGLAAVSGDYIAFVDHDDILTNDCLATVAQYIEQNGRPGWLYSDEFKVGDDGEIFDLFPKPDWSPLLLVNYMYVGHLTVVRRDVADAAGALRTRFDFSQDYDFALRLAEMAGPPVHIEGYIYGWRAHEQSAAGGGKPYARASNLAALQAAFNRRGWPLIAYDGVVANRAAPLQSRTDTVSLIIPSDNSEHIRAAVQSLASSTHAGREVVVVTRPSVARECGVLPGVKFVHYDKPFNFSDKCNAGARSASGSILIFFNDDVRVIAKGWIEELLVALSLPNVGAAGPKLVYENGTLQHAGMVTGVRRFVGTAYHTYSQETLASFGAAQSLREVSLLCGAVLAIRADLFHEVGGFDAERFPISHSDVDLCFRIRQRGLTCVYVPTATLVHIGHLSRSSKPKMLGEDPADRYLVQDYQDLLARDPYFPREQVKKYYIDSTTHFRLFPGRPARSRDRASIILSHDLSASGAPKVALDCARAFQNQGDFVLVVAPEDGPMRERLTAEGITVLIDERLNAPDEWLADFVASFDRVVVNTVVLWPVMRALQGRDGVYWYLHEAQLIEALSRENNAVREVLGSARKVLLVSEYARSAAALDREVDFVPPAVKDLGFEPKEQEGDGPLRIGILGSIEHRKGQDILLDALRLLTPAEAGQVEVHAAGRTLQYFIEDSMREYAAPGCNLVLHGEISHEEVARLLKSLDAVAIPSRDDPSPLAGLEAMSAGVLILASPNVGYAQDLRERRAGLVVEPNTPEAWATALRDLLNNRSRFEEARNARRLYDERYTLQRFEERITRICRPRRQAADHAAAA